MELESQDMNKNVVFLGVTGVGKSTTCNYLVGDKVFASSEKMSSCTI